MSRACVRSDSGPCRRTGRHRLLVSCVLVGLFACGEDVEVCGRVGGAFVSLTIVEETFTAWVTDEPFIDEAIRLRDSGEVRVPVFAQVMGGGDDCADDQWAFHVDPTAVEWADATIELCDAVPSYVDANLEQWQREVGQWCPWQATVSHVVDRR